MTRQLEHLQGYLRANVKKYGDASHVGIMNINGKNNYLYGYFEEKELVDEYGKTEISKYFKLWTTDSSGYKPNKDRLSNDASNVGFLAHNTERETHKHPLYKGSIKINGSTYYLGCWKNSKKEMINGDLVINTIFAIKLSLPQNNNNHNNHNDYSEQDPDYSDVPF